MSNTIIFEMVMASKILKISAQDKHTVGVAGDDIMFHILVFIVFAWMSMTIKETKD